jgi:hypothetical protein
MHKRESQSQFIKHLEEMRVKDALHPSLFSYDFADFENVPPVLPEFLFHLYHRLNAITEHNLALSKEESTQEAKRQLTQEITVRIIN